MAPGRGSKPPPPPPPELAAFKKLVEAYNKRPTSTTQQKFVKKIDNIPTVALPAEEPYHAALNISERGLIGLFTGLWPSLKAIDSWVQRNWRPLVTEGIKSHFVANRARSRFMRLTEAVDKLKLQAATSLKAGKEFSAREMLLQKREVLQALEKCKNRVELLDELLTKLGEAISVKETELIKTIVSTRFDMDIEKETEGPVRVVSSKEVTSCATENLEEHFSLDPGSKDTNMAEEVLRTVVNDAGENHNRVNQKIDTENLLTKRDRIGDDYFHAIFKGIDSYESFLIYLENQVAEMELKLHTFLKFSSLILEDEAERSTNQKVKTAVEILEALKAVRTRIGAAMGNGETSI